MGSEMCIRDRARVRLSDPGDPSKCPVFGLHEIYSDADLRDWASSGCKQGNIGCIDCKKPRIDSINKEQSSFIERAEQFENNPDLVRSIIMEGSETAREIAKETLEDVRAAIGISYR